MYYRKRKHRSKLDYKYKRRECDTCPTKVDGLGKSDAMMRNAILYIAKKQVSLIVDGMTRYYKLL
jgi:hypothetical protein